MRYIDLPEIQAKYKCTRWKKTRIEKLQQTNYFCERCIKQGIYNSAKIVHHKEYINNLNYIDDDIFYKLDNLEALCQECHNKEHFSTEEDTDYVFDEDGNVVKR